MNSRFEFQIQNQKDQMTRWNSIKPPPQLIKINGSRRTSETILVIGTERLNMDIDWNLVKKMTLWNYEELMSRILKVLSYDFIQQHYNHNMKEAENYAIKLLGYDPRYAKSLSRFVDIFRRLESLNVADYTDLVRQFENREKCEEFLRRANLPFKDMISMLNYIFRWVLPFKNVYLRQLVDINNETHKQHLKELAKLNIKFNLDILEHGRTKEGRAHISMKIGVPEAFVINLVNRADLTRLPFMSRKTVDHLSGGGYDTIEKIARADRRRFKEDMKSYFDKKGIRLSRSFIELEGIGEWARAIPKIVEI